MADEDLIDVDRVDSELEDSEDSVVAAALGELLVDSDVCVCKNSRQNQAFETAVEEKAVPSYRARYCGGRGGGRSGGGYDSDEL